MKKIGILSKKIKAFFFSKIFKKEIVLCCCLFGLLCVIGSVVPETCEEYSTSTGVISRASKNYKFGTQRLDLHIGVPPRQEHENWCVFACMTYFKARSQCIFASTYCNMIKSLDIPFDLNCCSVPPSITMEDPKFDLMVLQAWNIGCMSGVSMSIFLSLVNSVGNSRRVILQGELQTRLHKNDYIGEVFPCYGVMLDYNGHGHCILLCGVQKFSDSYTIYYWDPATASYQTIYSGSSEWLSKIYYYRRY